MYGLGMFLFCGLDWFCGVEYVCCFFLGIFDLFGIVVGDFFIWFWFLGSRVEGVEDEEEEEFFL